MKFPSCGYKQKLSQATMMSVFLTTFAVACTQTEVPTNSGPGKGAQGQNQGTGDQTNKNSGSPSGTLPTTNLPNNSSTSPITPSLPTQPTFAPDPTPTLPPVINPPVINPPVITPTTAPAPQPTPVINPTTAPAPTPTNLPPVINPNRGDITTRAPYTAVPAGYSTAQVTQWVTAHQARAGQGFRYVYITPEVAANAETANTVRVAIAKAWNHLSWQPEIDVPEDVSDGAGLVFALNTQKIWAGDAAANWGFIAACSPKANIRISPAPRGDCAAFDANQPVPAQRFVYNAVHGGPYANVHKTPSSYSNFTRKYTMGKIFALSTQKDAIVCGPRVTAFRVAFPGVARNEVPQYNTVQEAIALIQSGKGILYSYTSDEFDGRDNGNIRYRTAPTDRDQRSTGALNAGPGDGGTAVASEWWMQLPNGMMYYSIHGEGSQERGKGEFPFAIDPANWKQGSALATGRSCITCHIKGNQAALSDPEIQGANGWTSNAELTVLNEYSGKRFSTAMEKITRAMSDDQGPLNEKIISGTVEPVKQAIMLIEGRFQGRATGTCTSFCNGKFGSRRKNMCETLPAR